jgi:glycosyltransferase involved in cell wall biosynthesis
VVAKVVVLQVIARMNIGGTSKYLLTLSKELEAIGIKSPIAAGFVQLGEVEDPELKKIKPIRIRHLGRKISPLNDYRAMIELRKVILQVRPDIIHTHTFKAGLIARAQRNKIEKILGKKIKFIHTFHGHLFDDPQFKGFKALVISAIEKSLSKKSDQLITVGENVKNDLESRGIKGKKKTISIPPAVIPLKLLSKESALKKFKVRDKNRIRVIWMARVTGVKNPLRLIGIANSLPNIDFYLAGGGELLEEIKVSAPKNLKVLGWQDAKNVLPIADIFLSTSENEGMPIALIEAQLAGIPVVATDVGSVSEVIIDNKTGLLCSKSNSELIKAINELVQNKCERLKFGKNGKMNALKLFSEKKLISTHKDLYSKLR